MESGILRRILASSGVPNLVSLLAGELTASDLNSLLLEVFKRRAASVQEKTLMVLATNLTAPSEIDARLLAAFDQCAYQAAADFQALDLSPVCVFGTASTLGGIDQSNLLTALRGTELPGDSTPILAMECARRLKAGDALVRLCSSHRLIRMQKFDFPGFSPHFRLFGLTSAARDTGSMRFELKHLGEFKYATDNLDFAFGGQQRTD